MRSASADAKKCHLWPRPNRQYTPYAFERALPVFRWLELVCAHACRITAVASMISNGQSGVRSQGPDANLAVLVAMGLT